MTPTEREILDLENTYWQALQAGDVETAIGLTDEPCFVTGASGVGSIDHEQFAAMIKAAEHAIDDYRIADARVRMLGDDVAIVAYRVSEELTIHGRPIHVDAADSSTWVRRDGRWLCAQHSEALRGDPYGRAHDETAPHAAARFIG